MFAVNVYRAATQSITTDEAFTYTRSVRVPIPELWEQFDANDHVLHTLLCKVSTKWFGASEFTLRFPALAGGLLYLWICLRLCEQLTKGGWALLLSYSLLVLNPLMLDYGSIARGYGLAVSFQLAAIHQTIQLLRAPLEQRRYYWIGILSALAITANLTALFPSAALLLVFAIFHLGRPFVERNWPRVQDRLGLMLDRLVVPASLLCVAVLLVPLLPARKIHFYVGSKTLVDAATTVVYAVLWRPYNLLDGKAVSQAAENAVFAMGVWLLLAILVASLVLALWRRRVDLFSLVTAVTVATIALLVLAHTIAGVLYPERRTGLYFVPLFTLMAIGAAQAAPLLLRRIAGGIGVVFLVIFVASWNVRFYDEWPWDADHRATMQYLRERAPTDGRTLTIGATFPFARSVDYYREIWKLKWLAPCSESADGAFDIYILALDRADLIEKHHLTVRARFSSGVMLAVPASSALRP